MCIPEEGCIHVCVIRDTVMALVGVIYDPATGDSTYRGQRFGDAFPVTSSFAQNADWYVNNEPVTYKGRRYVKHGLPRALGYRDVVHDGEFLGVPVFAAPPGPPTGVIYLPVKPGCEFQPYYISGVK